MAIELTKENKKIALVIIVVFLIHTTAETFM